MANPCHKEEAKPDKTDRLSKKHAAGTSQLNADQHAFMKRLGNWLGNPASGYTEAQTSGLEVQVCNSKANCRRWCHDDPDDPYCCG